MSDPFQNRAMPLSGPARDILPVIPDDGAELPAVAIGLFVEIAGRISLVTAAGEARTVSVPPGFLLPVGVRAVRATGTTASGIHALVVS